MVVQSRIDRAALTQVSLYKPSSYLCHAPGMLCWQHLKKEIFILPLNVSVNCLLQRDQPLQMVFLIAATGNLVVVGLMRQHLSNQA